MAGAGREWFADAVASRWRCIPGDACDVDPFARAGGGSVDQCAGRSVSDGPQREAGRRAWRAAMHQQLRGTVIELICLYGLEHGNLIGYLLKMGEVI